MITSINRTSAHDSMSSTHVSSSRSLKRIQTLVSHIQPSLASHSSSAVYTSSSASIDKQQETIEEHFCAHLEIQNDINPVLNAIRDQIIKCQEQITSMKENIVTLEDRCKELESEIQKLDTTKHQKINELAITNAALKRSKQDLPFHVGNLTSNIKELQEAEKNYLKSLEPKIREDVLRSLNIKPRVTFKGGL